MPGPNTQTPEPDLTQAGLAADHVAPPSPAALVAPGTAKEHNTLRDPLRPRACWMVEDARFDFDSSFVLPEIEAEIRLLVKLRKRFPKHPLSIFAHADPVGNDDYNKTLSGRRAIAIYALLTRRVDLWEDLFEHPFGNDQWGDASLQTMADTLASPPPAQKSLTDDQKAIAFFDDADRGPGCLIFAVNRGNEPPKPASTTAAPPADPKTRAAKAKSSRSARKELFREYMDRLCGPDCELNKEEFLGGGADAGGKADYQGCGEFNPILLFSRAEAQQFEKDQNHEERNEQNAPNRRVLVYLFPPGPPLEPQLWPCPRAKEGPEDCRKRFWSDAETRRSNQAERREYAKTRDTFACRFYDRLAHVSPCETAPIPVRVRLYDSHSKFIPHAPFRLTLQGQPPREGRASAKGIFSVRRHPGVIEGLIEWGLPSAAGQPPVLSFHDRIFLEFPDEPREAALRKLQNLGYGGPGVPEKERVSAFQRDYRQQFGLEVTGVLDPKTMDAINQVHDSMADQLRKSSS